jgi:HTH-type transcriptional regulator/antitoxin HigA
MLMNIRPINNEADYKAALAIVSPWFDHEPEAGTEDAARFDILVSLIQTWEEKHYPMAPPDSTDATKFRMEQSA